MTNGAGSHPHKWEWGNSRRDRNNLDRGGCPWGHSWIHFPTPFQREKQLKKQPDCQSLGFCRGRGQRAPELLGGDPQERDGQGEPGMGRESLEWAAPNLGSLRDSLGAARAHPASPSPLHSWNVLIPTQGYPVNSEGEQMGNTNSVQIRGALEQPWIHSLINLKKWPWRSKFCFNPPKDNPKKPYLSKIEFEFFSKEFCLVQLDPGICCR